MERDYTEEVKYELVEELIDATLPYWDSYYDHSSVLNPLREKMKKLLDKYDKS